MAQKSIQKIINPTPPEIKRELVKSTHNLGVSMIKHRHGFIRLIRCKSERLELCFLI